MSKQQHQVQYIIGIINTIIYQHHKIINQAEKITQVPITQEMVTSIKFEIITTLRHNRRVYQSQGSKDVRITSIQK